MASVVVDFNLAAADGGFSSAGSPVQWEWGVAVDGPVGVVGWGTRLDGPYLHESDSTLTLPPLEVSGLLAPAIRFHLWMSILDGDSVVVEVDPGSGWTRLDPVYGYPSAAGFAGEADFADAVFSLAGFGSTPSVRLLLRTDAVGVAAGLTIDGAWLVDGDAAAPQLLLVSAPTDTDDLDGPYVVVVDAVDDVGVIAVTVRSTLGDVVAEEISPGRWAGELAPGGPPGTVVSWHAEATDGENIGRLPAEGESSFRLFLPPPTDVVVTLPEGRAVVQNLSLAFTAPATDAVPLAYQVRLDGAVVGQVAESPALLALDFGGSVLDVAGVFAEGVGDFSEPVTIDVSVPSLISVTPDRVALGAQPYVEIVGESLGLFESSTADLGAGVVVETMDVIDVNRARLTVAVAPDADDGQRTLTLTGVWGTFLFPDAFVVDSDEPVPAVVDVQPPTVAQGKSVVVNFTVNVPLGAVVALATDEHIVVTGTPTSAHDVVSAELAVSGGAPLGAHTVIIDDGTRLLSATVEVTETVFAPAKRCGSAPGTYWSWGLAAWVLRARRASRSG